MPDVRRVGSSSDRKMITTSITMKRVWSTAPVRKLTKIHNFNARSTAIGSTLPLGASNVRRVSNLTGGGPPVSLVLAIGVGLPIVLWTYKVGLSAILGVREEN